MKIFSGAIVLFAVMALGAADVSASGGNRNDSAEGSSPGGQQSQQQPSVMNDQQTVKQVQQALNAKGYNAGQADGNWSSKSRDAIAQFQKDNGLDPTGRIDQQSLALLGVTSASSGSGAGGHESKQPASTDQQQGSYGQMGNQGGPGGGQTNPEQTSP